MHRPAALRDNRWILPPLEADERPLEAGEAINPILRQILRNRGIDTAADIQAFLERRYLPSRDPFLLVDMDRAVDRIRVALDRQEVIVVYGDFDADGVTSTVLLTEALRGFVDDRRLIRPYIPDRVDEGYGLNLEALTKLREAGAGLVISVDCGIRSPLEVAHAQSIGLDMIVSDHHSIGHDLPPATAVINPKRADCRYPEKMLAGVGIAYKIAEALHHEMPERAGSDPGDLLDLVAIGTIADLAPLLGENRRLVTEGLEVLNDVRRPGIAALLNVSGLHPGSVTAENVAFAIGPRINAAGRLAHAYDAAKLLAATDSFSAEEYAHKLNNLNRDRQSLTRSLGALAEAGIDPDAPILIASDPSFKSGIVGLVASRLAEKYYRPAIVMEHGESESRGSCRSIPEFHITQALDEVADLLVRHGGHAQAAGFTIRNDHIPAFISRMTDLAADRLAGQDLRPSLKVDAVVPLRAIDWALQEHLAQLEPTGYDNPAPLFVSRNVEVISHRTVGQDGSHLQMVLHDHLGHGDRVATPAGSNGRSSAAAHRSATFSAIAFRQAAWAAHMPAYIDVAYTVGVNQWNGSTSLQLVVEDFRPTTPSEDANIE